MFGFGKRDHVDDDHLVTVVGQNTRISGSIECFGDGYVYGHVDGNVSGNDAATLVCIGEHGAVNGNVSASHVLIEGTVTGDVTATELLTLAATARIEGNVRYTLAEMAAGAQVDGRLEHVPDKNTDGEPVALEGHAAEIYIPPKDVLTDVA